VAGRGSAGDSKAMPQPGRVVAVAPDNGPVAGEVSAEVGRAIPVSGRDPAGDVATGDGR